MFGNKSLEVVLWERRKEYFKKGFRGWFNGCFEQSTSCRVIGGNKEDGESVCQEVSGARA